MKAACLMVCLALAQGISGRIFRQQEYPRMDSLIVQPLETLDQYQQQLNQWMQRTNTRSPESNYNSNEYRNQRQRHRNKDSVSNEGYSQEANERYVVPNSASYSQEQTSQKLNIQKNTEKWNNKRILQDKDERDSQEWNNMMNINDGYVQPMNPATSAKRNLALYTNQKVMQPAFGDAITWKGLRIAVGGNSPVKTNKDIEKIFAGAYRTMKTVSDEDKKRFHDAYVMAVKNVPDVNAKEMLINNQYPVEEYYIKTDDGYNLTLYRIQKQGYQKTENRPVVFLMHDLLGSADDFLVMGPKTSLAYLLADAGYDVYLGNARGNKYSRRHVSKHPAQQDFWQFSIDEIAQHDLPAMIDFALRNSNQPKLYYVGHGLGNTALFALASSRPEYNDKIITMYALSPMVYLNNVRSPLLRMIAPNNDFSERLFELLGNGEFKPSKELIHTMGGDMCEDEIGCKYVCSNIYPVMSGVNMDNFDAEVAVMITKHLPAGASTRLFKHFGQNVASGELRKYDFGYETNKMVYGTIMPPKYDMKKVTVPVALYFSEEDWLASPEDVSRLQKDLPTVWESYKVPENFSHLDFQFSRRAPEFIYNHLIESMQKNELY